MSEVIGSGVMHPTGLHRLGHGLWFGPVHAALLRVAAVKPGETVLDVGAGTGALSERLVRSGAQVVCLEPDSGSLATAQLRLGGSGVEFINAAVEDIPLPDSSVDVAIASLTAHHWADPDVGFAELARVLRPGGRLVMAEFRSGGALLRKVRTLAGSKHVDAPALTSWQARLKTAGFRDAAAVRGGWASALVLFVSAIPPEV